MAPVNLTAKFTRNKDEVQVNYEDKTLIKTEHCPREMVTGKRTDKITW